jgi:hypothetical protein
MKLDSLSVKQKTDMFVALEDPLRYNMMTFIYNKGGEASHSAIAYEFKLSDKDYEHHANLLIDGNIIKPSKNHPLGTYLELVDMELTGEILKKFSKRKS